MVTRFRPYNQRCVYIISLNPPQSCVARATLSGTGGSWRSDRCDDLFEVMWLVSQCVVGVGGGLDTSPVRFHSWFAWHSTRRPPLPFQEAFCQDGIWKAGRQSRDHLLAQLPIQIVGTCGLAGHLMPGWLSHLEELKHRSLYPRLQCQQQRSFSKFYLPPGKSMLRRLDALHPLGVCMCACVCVWLWGCIDEALTQYPSHVSSLPALPHHTFRYPIPPATVLYILNTPATPIGCCQYLRSPQHSLKALRGTPSYLCLFWALLSVTQPFESVNTPLPEPGRCGAQQGAMDEATHGCSLGLTPCSLCVLRHVG